MSAWFNYSIVAPLVERYIDDGTRILCTGQVSIGDTGDFEVSVIGSDSSIELIRVATLNSDGNLTPKQQETVGKLVDHMIAVLRFTYRPDVDLVRFGENTVSFGTHDKSGKPTLNVSMQEVFARQGKINSENIRNTFIAGMGMRHLFKLLSDTQNDALPLQYKFLSLYKAYELEFREGKKWPKLGALFAVYDHRYKELNISQKTFVNLFHALRDKCAHIKTGNDDELGIVGLDGVDAKAVAAVFPLLKEIISTYIPTKYPSLQFSLPGQAVFDVQPNSTVISNSAEISPSP